METALQTLYCFPRTREYRSNTLWWYGDHKWNDIVWLMDLFGQTKKQLTWKAWAKIDKVRLRPWSPCPRRTDASKNAIVRGFRVKECKINQLHSSANTRTAHTYSCRLTTCSHILASRRSARRTTVQLWSVEPWCAHQRCLQRWLIFLSVRPKPSIWYFLGWAKMSSLAISSCLVNGLSSMTISFQELWSREELTSTILLD